MSLLKIITPDAQDFGEPTTQLIKVSSRGLLGDDRQQFVKRASAALASRLDSLLEQQHPDEPLVHLLAVGSTEQYGSNRNGDGFKKQACQAYHPTFVKHARLYRDHANKNPAKSYGRVVDSWFNDRMGRIELVCGLNATEKTAKANGGLVADREMEKLAQRRDIPVSMACVLDPAYPVLTRDRGYVGIGSIRIGDLVWTHAGRWRPVTQLNRRRYTGETFTFRSNGLPLPLELTADHPMWAKVFEGSRELAAMKTKAGRFFADAAAFNAAPAGWTHASHIGIGDRFFYTPLTRYTEYGSIADANLAAVMGYYLAEGSFNYNGERACTTQFTCNMSDSLPRRLPRLVEGMFPDVTVTISPKANSKPGLSVDVHSTEFSEFLRQYVGRGVLNKVIPPEIFNAAREIKLAFLGAWLDGDGWLDKKGCHWSSANIGLVLQGRDLLATLGMPASIYRINHANCPTSGYDGSGIEYTLNISHLDVWNLAEYAQKVADYPVPTPARTKPAAMRLCPDGRYAYRVSRVTSRFVSDVETYNFEVAEDESYSLAGLISHNCKVAYDVCSSCGNKAPTKEDYCAGTDQGGHCKAGGLRDRIGQLVELDGGVHQLHADNPHPCFFDISHVIRPADRIAYVSGLLEKAAADKRMVKSAELAAAVQVGLPLSVQLEDAPTTIAPLIKLAYACLDAATADTDILLSLPSPASEAGVSHPDFRHKTAQCFRALSDRRICLPLPQFLQLLTGQPQEKTAMLAQAAAPYVAGAFDRLTADPNLVQRLIAAPYHPAVAAAPSLEKWANDLAAQFSYEPHFLVQRAQRVALRGRTPQQATAVKAANDRTPAARLAEEYALYQLAYLGALPKSDLPLTVSLLKLQNDAVATNS